MCKHSLRFCILFVVLVVAFGTANAQEFRGSLQGQVLDPQESVVAGATVTLKNVATNVEATVTTGEDGSYSFSLLQPGKYIITVTKQGFTTATREGIEI